MPPIEPDRLYHAGELAAFPMVFWRSGTMIYYLVGDEPRSVERAADSLRG